MSIFRVSGDLLHAFAIEVEADSMDDAIERVSGGEVYIADYDTSVPGFRVDSVVELDADGNEIEENQP